MAVAEIRRRNKPPIRQKAYINTERIRLGVKDITGILHTDKDIWESFRNKDMSRQQRALYYKNAHDAHKIGEYWKNIPNYEWRQDCPHCETQESKDHIYIECDAPGREIIWQLAEKLLRMKTPNWPQICYGTVFGSNLITIKDGKGKKDRGATRLYRIIMAESKHLIWKIRCERRISKGDDPEQHHSEKEIHNRWLHQVNLRLQLDQAMTNARKYGPKALSKKKVTETWSGTLLNGEDLPDDWVSKSGVLVGIQDFGHR